MASSLTGRSSRLREPIRTSGVGRPASGGQRIDLANDSAARGTAAVPVQFYGQAYNTLWYRIMAWLVHPCSDQVSGSNTACRLPRPEQRDLCSVEELELARGWVYVSSRRQPVRRHWYQVVSPTASTNRPTGPDA